MARHDRHAQRRSHVGSAGAPRESGETWTGEIGEIRGQTGRFPPKNRGQTGRFPGSEATLAILFPPLSSLRDVAGAGSATGN